MRSLLRSNKVEISLAGSGLLRFTESSGMCDRSEDMHRYATGRLELCIHVLSTHGCDLWVGDTDRLTLPGDTERLSRLSGDRGRDGDPVRWGDAARAVSIASTSSTGGEPC